MFSRRAHILIICAIIGIVLYYLLQNSPLVNHIVK